MSVDQEYLRHLLGFLTSAEEEVIAADEDFKKKQRTYDYHKRRLEILQGAVRALSDLDLEFGVKEAADV